MTEINFCPFCEAQGHKLMYCDRRIFYCKDCSRFFKFEELNVSCPRCKGPIKKSDFDSPSGGSIFMCAKCKQTYPHSEILDKIK